ncbi:MAG TPA: IS21 family transposase [Bacteroidia bacterium]|nr:IS21 family transposase [Bacteroidia bacterium]
MCNIRHILRLHTQNQTTTEIILQTGIARNVLKKLIQEFKESGLTFAEINELSDTDLAELFTKPEEEPVSEKLQTLLNLFPHIERELKRKGVTKVLLWEEYIKKHPDGVQWSQFKKTFRKWKTRVVPIMHKEHKAGDKLYIDYAGDKLSIIDKESGEAKPVEVFVAILGASQLTFVEAVMTQTKGDFIPACEDALHYIGGVPAAIVPDNLRSAVTKSNRYEPTINETFADFAEHYNTTILPARAYKPKDKALVEIAINIIYTRIYAKLRNEKFYSLEELNSAIAIALEEHNNLPITGRNYSRRQQFENMERAALLPLPSLRYEFKKRFSATVLRHGHVSLSADKHYYSVPYHYIGKKVKVMYSRYNVEIFYNYERIAVHKRLQSAYKYTTDAEHLPAAHRFVYELTTDRLLSQADEIHRDVRLYISKIINKKQHQEQAYKICLGILSLAPKFGNDRLIGACQRALDYGIYNYRTIKRILESGLEKNVDSIESVKMPEHENIRGKDYYQ